MPLTSINPARIAVTGLFSLLIVLNFLTACNSTEAQEQSPLKQRRLERLLRRNSGETLNTSNATNIVLRELSVGGLLRNYYIYTPSSYRQDRAMPLVLAFHGGRGRGDRFAQNTGLNDLAEQKSFIVVYPNGANNHWNDGRNTLDPRLQRVDDVSFVAAVIDDVARFKNIDSRRIYAVGTSNGGFFTQRLACEMSDRIAGFASVSATLPKSIQSTCNPRRASIPILMINGTADDIVPWRGGRMTQGEGGDILSVPDTVEFWRKHNANSNNAQVEQLPTIQADGTRVLRSQYSGSRSKSQDVVLYTVEGGGHGWPGSRLRRPVAVGKISQNLNASTVIWNFFEQRSL